MHPGYARFDGNRITGPAGTLAAAKPVCDRYTFHAAAEAQRQPLRWPDSVAQAGPEQICVRDGIAGRSVLFLRVDQIGRLQVGVSVPDDFLETLRVQGDTPSSVTRLNGLIHVPQRRARRAVGDVRRRGITGREFDSDAEGEIAFVMCCRV